MNPTRLMPPRDGDVILSNGYIAGITVMTVLAVLIAWLRMYTRIFVSRNTGWDDWTMFAASLVTLVTDAFLMNAYHHGLGRHAYYLKQDQITQTFMWLWTAEPTNLFAVYLVRLSIGLFFLRLIPAKKIYLWIIWCTIAALTASDIFVSIIYLFECRPIRKVWKPATPGRCFSQEVMASAIWLYQAVSILSDILLLAIPVFLFRKLQVQLRTRLALMFVCCLGIFTCACAVVKTVLLVNLFSANPDKTWIDAQLCLWAPLELCVGIICGTIPTLRPLLLTTRTTEPRPQGCYEGCESSYKLHPIENKPAFNGPTSPSASTPGKTIRLPHRLSRSSSRDGIMAARGGHQIRRTFEVEISNEGTGSNDGNMESQSDDWNAV